MGPRLRGALGEIGPWLPGYYGWLAIGATLAVFATAAALSRQDELPPRRALAALAVAFVAALIGSAVFPGLVALAQGRRFLAHGLVAYAGFAGGVLGAVVACRLLGVGFARLCDVTTPRLGIGIFFTRVGCLVAGCDFGAP